LKRIPSEANLRRAYKQLTDIKKRIELRTFNFEEEFPHYRFKGNLIATILRRSFRQIHCLL